MIPRIDIFFRGFLLIFLAPFAVAALRTWRPAPPKKVARPVADRIAWTVFALGICLMFNMALYASVLVSDGDYRTWETIAHHRMMLFAIALLVVSIPVGVFLYQAVTRHNPHKAIKKPHSDDLWQD